MNLGNIPETILVTRSFSNVVFIDQNVSDYTLFLNNINDVTFPILYNSSTTREEILSLLTDFSHLDRIAFVFHGIVPGYYYDKPFLENQPYFTLDGSGNIVVTENVTFIQTLLSKFTVSHVDFLGCNLLLSKEWRDYFDLLSGFGVVVGASNDNTGNLKYGGDWILENTMEDVRNVYFSSGLDSYSGLLIELIYNVNRYYYTFYTYSASNPTVLTRSIYDNNKVLQSSFDISFGGVPIQTVFSALDSGSGPYTLGLVDTNGNSVAMDVAFCGLYNVALTTTQAQKLMTYVNTTFKEPHTSATVYTVTVSGGVYWLNANGTGSLQQPNIIFASGGLYVFDQSAPSNAGNILVLGTTADSPTFYTGNVVFSGTPGILNAYTAIDFYGVTSVPSLYYYSSTKTIMGGTCFLQPVLNFSFSSSVTSTGSFTNFIYTQTPSTATFTTIASKNCIQSSNPFQITNLSYTNQNGYTIGFYLYLTSTSGGMIFDLHGSTNDATRFFGYCSPGNLSIGFTFSPTVYTVSASLNTWHYIAITQTKSANVSIYMDGTLLYGPNTSNSTYRSTNYTRLAFFYDYYGSSSSATGNSYLSNFVYFDAVLNSEQILNLAI